MRIGISGADGLLGWHLSCHLKPFPELKLVRGGREVFSSPESLDHFVQESDVIVHLAGMNRGDDQEVAQTNIQLAKLLIEAGTRARNVKQIIFASSVHIDRDTPYGQSKREGAKLFSGWAEQTGGKFANLVLPGVFGERGKPFYNSVVSTFCHQIAMGEKPTVEKDSEIELLHAQQVSELIEIAIRTSAHGETRPAGHRITVSKLLEKIRELHSLYYEKKTYPDIRSGFERDLFNTYRSYLYPKYYPTSLKLNTDARGSFVEVVRDLNGGQASFSTSKPGVTRGNHFHRRKVERFCVLSGEARIQIRRLYDKEVLEFQVGGSQPCFIDMPTLHTHNISNIGTGELLTLFWANEMFDPANPDTFSEQVG